MHILVVTQYFWPENFRINDVAATLVERGHAVTVVTGVPNYPRGRFFQGYGIFKKCREQYRGCQVIHIPLVPRGNSGPLNLVLNYLSFAAAATLFTPLLSDRSFDAILVCQLSPATVGIPAMAFKRLRKLPLVLWVLDLWPDSLFATGAIRSRVVLRLVGQMVSLIYRSSDLILASSRTFIPEIERRGGRSGSIHYFPNWAEKFDARAPIDGVPLRVDLPDGGFRIMFAGNIGQAQSFETIIAAAERLKVMPDIHWMIAGDGRRREWLEQQVRDRALQKVVHVLGSYPPDRMPALFAQADALLVTLSRDPLFALTAPGKLQSYLASGKMIVGAIDGEGRRVLEESGAAVTCDPEDPCALADAVMTAYRMPACLRQSMGESGRKYCSEHFNRESLMDQLESLILGAVVSNAPRERVAG